MIMKIIDKLYFLFKFLGVYKNKSLRNKLFSAYFLLFRFRMDKGLRVRHSSEYQRSLNFVKYLYKSQKTKKIIQLKKGLDNTSKRIVDLVINRYIYIYTHNVIMEDDIHSQQELEEEYKADEYLKKNRKSYILSKDHYEQSVFYYKHGLVFLPRSQIKKLENKDFIDAGAYIGDSAIVFSKHYRPNKIYSFEPNRHNFALLTKTVEINKPINIIPIKKGLGDTDSTASMTFQKSGSFISEGGKHPIEITTIDNFIRRKKINLGLIKMDLEGYELEAIKGAEKTIKKFKPILLVSIYHTGKDFFEIKPLIENWVKGYKFMVRKLNPIHPTFETTLIGYYEKK